LSKKLSLTDNPTILFQGDSITDSGRKSNHNESLGDGYVMMTAAWLSALYPEYHMKFYNRGVGGDRIRDLRCRWKKDCLDLRPRLVSILIGVNDVLSEPFWKRSTPTESFQSDYTSILEQTQLSKCQIVLLEPFLVHSSGNFLELADELNKKIEVVRELAREFDATLIPLNDIFLKACIKGVPSFWALDGIHPTLAGHALIAQSWIKGVMEEL
jgi:lysophospholipase L1-like esterase